VVAFAGFFLGTNLSVGADLKVDDAFGWAAKAGADIHITGNLYANVDVMYLNAEHDAKLDGDKFDLDLKVWSYNVGLKYRF
jgi:outer membrane protein